MPHADPALIYLGRNRLHRSRANLIQTLHTVAAMQRLGVPTRLYVPPWPRGFDARVALENIGVPETLDVRRASLLHPRWKFWPFVWLRRSVLAQAGALYTRTPEISLALAGAKLVHHLEVHDVAGLDRAGLLGPVVRAHREGHIGRLVPISQAAAGALTEAGAEADRLHVAPSGVDLAAYAEVPALDPDRLDRPRVVYLGRLSRDRGLGVLCDLAQRGKCELTLVGDAEGEVPAGVAVEPFVAPREVPRWYAKTDVVVLPYQRDLGHADSISPIKLFEAMAAGRPIVASDLPAIREVVRHEETALLVDPADAEAWPAALDRLREDRDLAVRLATRARAEAENYSWDRRAGGIARAIGLRVDPGGL